jgi:hypothetical protein
MSVLVEPFIQRRSLATSSRNLSPMPCERCWKPSVFLENRNKLHELLKLLLQYILLLGQVVYSMVTYRLDANRLLKAEIRSEDAVYVLAYSVIMLNTDLHNPQVKVCVPLTSAH